MPAERLKFRCYRCSQLLSVAPSRAGTVVSCPKCKADLLIPAGETQPEAEPEARVRNLVENRGRIEVELQRRAEPQAPSGGTESRAKETAESSTPADAPWAATSTQAPPSPGSAIGLPDELAAMIPPDLVDLKPEDLRVEAEFFESLTRRPPRMTAAEPAPWPPPEAPAPAYSHEVLVSPAPPPPFETAGQEDAASSPAVLAELRVAVPKPALVPAPSSPDGAVAPPIEIEPPSLLPPGAEIRRVSEVTLPAAVVLAWSLFVLAGIAMSFIAGLMIGHYLWKLP
jgi:phage FluMu protein Com